MTSSSQSSMSNPTTPVVPIAPAAADSSSIQITCHKLNDQNYLQWSQSVMMFIRGKGKDEFISGTSTCSAKSNPKFRAWDSENYMVMSC